MGKLIYRTNSIKTATLGLGIIAIVTWLLQLSQIFVSKSVVSAAVAVITVLCWFLVLIGSFPLCNYRHEFKKNMLFGILGTLSTGLEVWLLFQWHRQGLLASAFLSEKVLFAAYIGSVSMLLAYWYLSGGFAQLLAKFGEIEDAKKLKSLSKVSVIFIFLTFIIVPVGHIFEGVASISIVGTASSLGMFVQLNLCRAIRKAANFIDGLRG